MKISGIIMASGLSKRMGTNKLLLGLKGKKLYQYVFDIVEKLNLDEVILVSSYDDLLEDGKSRGFKGIFNHNNQVGKSESIRLGVEEAKADNALMFFVADQPLLTLETCQRLIEAYRENEYISYPRTDKRRGSPVIFSKKYRDGLLGLKEDQGGMLLVAGQEVNEVFIEEERELFDIDTIEAYKEVKEKYE